MGKDAKLKIVAIGQSIMQATRLKAIKSSPQVGLAVKIHHQQGGPSLVDTFSAMGFCSSYYETSLFEQNASVSANIEVQVFQGKFCMHHVVDNANYNIRTTDGHNTILMNTIHDCAERRITTCADKSPAPPSLLSVFHFNCKSDCLPLRGSCMKPGLKFTWACGNCKGTSYSNCETVRAGNLEDDGSEQEDQIFE